MKFVNILIFSLIVFGLRAQDNAIPGALQVLGAEKCNAMTASGMEAGFIEFLNTKGYYFQEQDYKSFEEFKDALEVQPRSADFPAMSESLIREGFSLFAYDFPLREKHYGYYRVGNSNMLLVIYPLELSRKLYEKTKQATE